MFASEAELEEAVAAASIITSTRFSVLGSTNTVFVESFLLFDL